MPVVNPRLSPKGLKSGYYYNNPYMYTCASICASLCFRTKWRHPCWMFGYIYAIRITIQLLNTTKLLSWIYLMVFVGYNCPFDNPQYTGSKCSHLEQLCICWTIIILWLDMILVPGLIYYMHIIKHIRVIDQLRMDEY